MVDDAFASKSMFLSMGIQDPLAEVILELARLGTEIVSLVVTFFNHLCEVVMAMLAMSDACLKTIDCVRIDGFLHTTDAR